jgi:NADPH-dependent 2,4-dienoyl-CoA reductase/sulfur reductase-like enzyme/nitrite reductase/ring-hydroxylating ferredoxin subunit
MEGRRLVEKTMAQEQCQPNGPDLTRGVPLDDFVDGKLAGHAGGEEVLLVHNETGLFAIGAHCTHYNGPLAEGLVAGSSVRCPWHHACFDLSSGEALRAPALSPLACWRVEEQNGRVFVREKLKQPMPRRSAPEAVNRIVIVGGGAAGFAAAEMLRRRGFSGSIAMVSSDGAAPVDRPNLSKDYLAGTAPEEWVPLRPDSFYRKADIELNLNTEVVRIDRKERCAVTADGKNFPYDRLLLAMGAEPVRLTVPGADLPHVHTLRSFADSQAIIEAAKGTHSALVIGASFIGLEVAASLRARGIEVHVAAPDKRPMERVLGPEMGDFIRGLHEEHGVVFHLQDTVAAIESRRAILKSGQALEAGLVVAGVGVRPRLALAEEAGLTTDRGVLVNEFLEASASGIYAAGDIARWPDPHSGENIRVEHWVVAERQGQTAALNMMGECQKFDAVPFFWSQHYDVPVNYIGHAAQWDAIEIEGDIKTKDCLLKYKSNGRTAAVASIFRDLQNLQAEVAMEQTEAAAC